MQEGCDIFTNKSKIYDPNSKSLVNGAVFTYHGKSSYVTDTQFVEKNIFDLANASNGISILISVRFKPGSRSEIHIFYGETCCQTLLID